MRDIIRMRGTHYHAQLGHPDKGHGIKGLVVCYEVLLRSMDESLKKCKVRGLVPFCGQDGYRAQVTPHRFKQNTCHITQFMYLKRIVQLKQV